MWLVKSSSSVCRLCARNVVFHHRISARGIAKTTSKLNKQLEKPVEAFEGDKVQKLRDVAILSATNQLPDPKKGSFNLTHVRSIDQLLGCLDQFQPEETFQLNQLNHIFTIWLNIIDHSAHEATKLTDAINCPSSSVSAVLDQIPKLLSTTDPNDASKVNKVLKLYKLALLSPLPMEHDCMRALHDFVKTNCQLAGPLQLLAFVSFHNGFAYRNEQSGQLQQHLVDSVTQDFSRLFASDMSGSARLRLVLLVVGVPQIVKRTDPNVLASTLVGQVQHMSKEDLCGLLRELSAHGHRITPVLDAAATRIRELSLSATNDDRIRMKTVKSLYEVMSKLNFVSAPLLEALKRETLLGLDSIESAWVTMSLIQTFAQLRYRSDELLLTLLHLLDRQLRGKRLSAPPVATLLQSLARLNYRPSEQLLDQLVSAVVQDSQLQRDHALWLEVVFSAAVLGKLTQFMADSVTNVEFVRKILPRPVDQPVPPVFPQRVAHCKLLNIAAMARRLGSPDTNIAVPPINPAHKLPMCSVKYPTRVMTSYALNLQTLVKRLQPESSQCVETPYITTDGVVIDALMMIDREDRLIECSKWTSEPGRRVALMCWQYNHSTIDTSSDGNAITATKLLTGVNELSVNLLVQNGYQVVQVYEKELLELDSDDERLSLLKSRLCIASS